MWVEPVATSKLWDYPHPPHQWEFCTKSLLGRHALGMLGRTLHGCQREYSGIPVYIGQPFLRLSLSWRLQDERRAAL